MAGWLVGVGVDLGWSWSVEAAILAAEPRGCHLSDSGAAGAAQLSPRSGSEVAFHQPLGWKVWGAERLQLGPTQQLGLGLLTISLCKYGSSWIQLGYPTCQGYSFAKFGIIHVDKA